MKTKVQKWGNSFAVRLPKKIVDDLGIKEGNGVVIDNKKKTIIIRSIPLKTKVTRKSDWKRFVVPSNNKKEDVTKNIDKIVYGKSSR